jgi:hypothetical protein
MDQHAQDARKEEAVKIEEDKQAAELEDVKINVVNEDQ